ncbi:NADPH:quinone oxidoreductase family protein [Cohaesibacter sp. CAU 1516]|uniref:NADPH:quinone oxidoreductase family protein n=1 Tax=Cohaesibacter sp. CAU 1516 TaxID=2576038 RepID=UPI0010FF3004|nr:NADPH:quinone oxidoreductase family protein [Cohaesibacter sp. CAU 1516]TLP46966.1 NADPH:quinone oxidoreductase family protein [Cohaesibacter sp. CAU 1516]
MRAVLCEAFGAAENLVLKEIDKPVAEEGQVLIRVRAAALNFFDTLIIRNKYQYTPDLPFSPAGEISGEIEAVGAGVDPARIGERVLAYIRWGGAREYVVVNAEEAILMPEAMEFEQSAGLMITYGTTIYALKSRAKLQPGETLAVLGAAGGVGLAAVEIGKLMGARVIACASSDEKLDLCEVHGADLRVNYKLGDLKLALKGLTKGHGVDVVYDPVGGDLAEAALRATGWYGRFLVIGFASGTIPKMPLNLVMLKSVDLLGVFWGEAIVRNPEEHAQNMALIMQWVSEGKLKPHLHQSYPLEDTAKAIAAIQNREVKGKVVITL